MSDTLNIYACQMNPTVGDVTGNLKLIRRGYAEGQEKGADIVMFPELMLCGYSPEDVLLYPAFVEKCMEEAKRLAADTDDKTALLFGCPWWEGDERLNVGLFCFEGQIQAVITKNNLPNWSVMDELRYFVAKPNKTIVNFKGFKLGIPVCFDSWHPTVCAQLRQQGAEALLVINASPYHLNKHLHRFDFIKNRTEETQVPILYLNMFGGQDEVVFDGRTFTFNPGEEKPGNVFAAWKEDTRMLTLHRDGERAWFDNEKQDEAPFVEEEDIYNAIKLGLKDFVAKNTLKDVYIGLSGGIDSALSAVVAVDALGSSRVKAITLPSPYTSGDSTRDAHKLAKNLGIEIQECSINPALEALNTMLPPVIGDPFEGLVEENAQARLRGLVLMAASNAAAGSMVLTTGNKSELAVGYSTLYGDMCGGYSVLKDLYKTTVYKVAKWRNAQGETKVIPEEILEKEPSAELRPNQKDQDTLPTYENLDRVLKAIIEERKTAEELIHAGEEEELVLEVSKLLKRSEYKRHQAPPGVKVTPVGLGKDWRMPIANRFRL